MDIAKLRELLANVRYYADGLQYRGKAVNADDRDEAREEAFCEIDPALTDLENAAPALLARLEAAERVVEAARLFKEWCDKENAGPQYSSEQRREGPNGEAEWRKWWNEQLWLADQGPAQVEAALAAYDQAKE